MELAGHARSLADAVDVALPGWVAACVERVYGAWAGPVPDHVRERAVAAGRQAQLDIGGAVRSLLETDIDRQRSTPLQLLRGAVRYPSAVLSEAGVPPVVRDGFDEARFPGDRYGLTPASMAEIDPGLQELGLAWGAAKAWTHRERHRT